MHCDFCFRPAQTHNVRIECTGAGETAVEYPMVKSQGRVVATRKGSSLPFEVSAANCEYLLVISDCTRFRLGALVKQ